MGVLVALGGNLAGIMAMLARPLGACAGNTRGGGMGCVGRAATGAGMLSGGGVGSGSGVTSWVVELGQHGPTVTRVAVC